MAGRVHDACGQRGQDPGAGQQRAASLHGLRRLSHLSALFVHTCFLRLLELEHRLLPREIHSYHILCSGWVHHLLGLSCFQGGSRRSEANRCTARHESTLRGRCPRPLAEHTARRGHLAPFAGGKGRDPRNRAHGNPLKYSCLKHPMDRVAWRATVCRVAKSRT